MTGRLDGRVAIVTGGNSGIGETTVVAFAREGARVAIVARREDEGRRVENAVRDSGGDATFFACDVMERDSIESAVAAVVARYGNPSVLVNNAGGGVTRVGEAPTPTPSLDARGMPLAHDAAFDDQLRLNLTSAYLVTQICWAPMVDAGGGSIINVSSLAAVVAFANNRHMEGPAPAPAPAYWAAKAGLEAYTRWSAVAGSKFNIRANAIRPGLIGTRVHPVAEDGSRRLDLYERYQLTPGWVPRRTPPTSSSSSPARSHASSTARL